MFNYERFDDSVAVLDKRQGALVFGASAVVLVLVFALGVAVGKHIAIPTRTEPVNDPLTVLDQMAPEQEEVEPLQFAETLGGDREPAAKEKVAAAGAERKKAEAATKRDEIVTEPLRATVEVRKPAPAKAPTVAVAASATTAPKTTLKLASKAAPAKAPVTPTTAAASTPKESTNGRAFALQLTSFQDKAEAEQFAERLKGQGYRPRIVASEVEGKGLWYRVRIGAYTRWEDAMNAKQEFESKQSMIAYVARTQ